MLKTNITVAMIQHPPVFFDLMASLQKLETLLKETQEKQAELVVVPESWLPGYPIWLDYAPNAGIWDHAGAKQLYQLLVKNSITIGDTAFQRLLQLAHDYKTYLVIGIHEKKGNSLYNTQVLIAPDGDYVLHRKLVPTYTERLVWGQGDGSTLGVLNTSFGALGGLICWEHWMPLARATMHAQHEIIHVAQWPYVKEMHQIASRHYAFEGRCFVLASGCYASLNDMLAAVELTEYKQAYELLLSMQSDSKDTSSDQNKLLLKGGSAVIHPDGSYISQPVYDNNTTVFATINLQEASAEYMTLDTDGHYSRPDIFSLQVNTKENNNVVFRSSNTNSRSK